MKILPPKIPGRSRVIVVYLGSAIGDVDQHCVIDFVPTEAERFILDLMKNPCFCPKYIHGGGNAPYAMGSYLVLKYKEKLLQIIASSNEDDKKESPLEDKVDEGEEEDDIWSDGNPVEWIEVGTEGGDTSFELNPLFKELRDSMDWAIEAEGIDDGGLIYEQLWDEYIVGYLKPLAKGKGKASSHNKTKIAKELLSNHPDWGQRILDLKEEDFFPLSAV